MEVRALEKEKAPTIIAVKKWNKKGGKVYGPYPKDPDEFYLYEETWDPKKGRPVMKYLGRGKKPAGAIVKEVTGVSDFFKTGEKDENSPVERSAAAAKDPGKGR